MGRHGRKNRDKLREWKGKHDPEFQERMRVAALNRVDPETGRLLRYKKYADRELLVMTGGDQHDPELVWMHYDEIAKRNKNRDWVSVKMAKRFGLDAGLPQRCWYTGVQMYLVPTDLRIALHYYVPWECSREHLVCERNNGLGNGQSNIVIAGRSINDNLGHSPLPLKLLHRQEFAKREMDRETMTWASMKPWIDCIIEVENQYRLGAHYPWQPWAFDPGTAHRKIADAFNVEMMAEEQAFLALDDESRKQWLDEFVWRW
jgi:hypothetical protein